MVTDTLQEKKTNFGGPRTTLKSGPGIKKKVVLGNEEIKVTMMTRGRQKKEIDEINRVKEVKDLKKKDNDKKPTVKKVMKDAKNNTKANNFKNEKTKCKTSLKGKVMEK